jgi:hypothetical protein
MDADELQEGAARDQLWASLRALVPEIALLADGHFTGSEREQQLVQLLARIVASEMEYRAKRAESE